MSQPTSQQRITRADLEAKFQALQGGVEQEVADRKRTILMVGGGVAVVLLMLFFLLGKRSGTRKSTIVEIRRV